MIQKNKKSTKTSHNGQKDKVAINELKQSANNSKVQINRKTLGTKIRNIPTERHWR